MRVLRSMSKHTRRGKTRNEDIRDKVDKMQEVKLRCFEHIKTGSTNAPVKMCERGWW